VETGTRRVVPPLGWPLYFRAVKVRAAELPRIFTLNRYPRQVIGLGIRLPRGSEAGHPYLSIQWARPARWWMT
jgi:hypothetical protein